jgi:hypothetical protein
MVPLPASKDPSQDPLDRKVGGPQNASNPVVDVLSPHLRRESKPDFPVVRLGGGDRFKFNICAYKINFV